MKKQLLSPGILLFWVGAAFVPARGLTADPISMTFHSQNDTYVIEGRFEVKADPSVIWDVLTDYEHIPQFVKGAMKKSHVAEDLGVYHFLLEQEFEGGFLFFTKRIHLLLDVQEVWWQNIAFIDIDHKDFVFYRGNWSLTSDPGKGEVICYTLEVKPNFSFPFAGDIFHDGTRDLLEAVRREILRRQAALKSS